MYKYISSPLFPLSYSIISCIQYYSFILQLYSFVRKKNEAINGKDNIALYLVDTAIAVPNTIPYDIISIVLGAGRHILINN